MNYFAILTDIGIAKIAAGVFAPAIMQFGDTNRVPVSTDTSLVHKVCEANLINVIAENNKVIMEAIAPELPAGFWIREVGISDTDGDLIAIARYPETFKPADTDGSAKEVCVRMVLQISNASEIVVQFNHGAIEWVNRDLSNLSAIGQGVLTTIVENVLAEKAPLESPEFSGIPTAPTPTTETNTNQIATTEFVRTAIAALVNGSPAALDTLKELADALGGDENFATTITNLLSAKAPSASPLFTGVPTAPTAETGTATTQLATTEFVSLGVPVVIISVIRDSTTGVITITCNKTPTTKSVNKNSDGTEIIGSWTDLIFTPTTSADILDSDDWQVRVS